jgi:hypothetical protein
MEKETIDRLLTEGEKIARAHGKYGGIGVAVTTYFLCHFHKAKKPFAISFSILTGLATYITLSHYSYLIYRQDVLSKIRESHRKHD